MDEQEQKKILVGQLCGILGNNQPFLTKNRLNKKKPNVRFYVLDEDLPGGQKEVSSIDAALAEFIEREDIPINEYTSHDHYLYGVALKEIIFFEDAIKEFEEASKDEKEKLNSLEMMGLCYMELRNYKKALEIFNKGIQTIGCDLEKNFGLYFNAERCYKILGDEEGARDIHRSLCALLDK